MHELECGILDLEYSARELELTARIRIIGIEEIIMQRPISDFVLDAKGEWQASLNCGHSQSVRDNTSLGDYAWVSDVAARNAKLGTHLDCARCDRFELPESFVAYKRTPLFTEATVPAGLTNNHSTKTGVWAKINIVAGKLRYRVPTLNTDLELTPEHIGIVVPEVLHNVTPLGPVNFFVEFFKAP
jgi:tellurite resistance-related uncharacterized protein